MKHKGAYKPFQYRKAFKDAPPETKQRMLRFFKLPLKIRSKLPLLYYILNSGTPPYKMSKPDSDYGASKVEGQLCANCEFAYQKVVTGAHICSQIRGDIELNLWCRLWREADAEESNFAGNGEEKAHQVKKGLEYLVWNDNNVNGIGTMRDDKGYYIRIGLEKPQSMKKLPSQVKGVRIKYEVVGKTVAQNSNWRDNAMAYKTIFRNVLRDLRENRSKRPMGRYVPKNLNIERNVREILQDYTEGNRHGKFTITNFEMPDESTAIIGFQDMATLSGGAAELEYIVNPDKSVEYSKQLSVAMS